MAYTSSFHLPKHLLLPSSRRTRHSRPSSFVPVPAAANKINGGVNGHHAPEKPAPNGKAPQHINGHGKKGVNGQGGKKGVNGHVNGHTDRIHLSVSTGGGGGGLQDGSGLRVAFQGAPGAYSEFAAKTALPGCETVPCRAFADALAAVERGAADRAVLPVESTMEGTALRNYDLLLRHGLVVVQEINLFVHYCLLAMPGVRAAEVRRVISHPMALAHCGRALARLGVDPEPVEDTAGAVEMLRSERMLDTAAIASPRAADLYGLDVLAHGLQDESWNVTRFLLLSRPPVAAPPVDAAAAGAKTSMVVAHRGGSMMVVLKVLSAFSSRNINLTKLEVINNDGAAAAGSGAGARPSVMILDTSARGAPTLRAFPHVLYVDCEGAAHDPRVREAIQEIETFAVFVRVLGCYAADSTVYDLQ
ncbi:arogenate dehydratase 2-like [Miscanthus floridulus]|uniref:arogenate dehydratase 2-like n=1 Tax=Miscanthus floridulus TaxID=154761 RepID=UPI00345849CE